MNNVSHAVDHCGTPNCTVPSVRTSDGKEYTSIALDEDTLQKADCVVLTTNHDVFDADIIRKNALMIVDLRNMIQEGSRGVYKL